MRGKEFENRHIANVLAAVFGLPPELLTQYANRAREVGKEPYDHYIATLTQRVFEYLKSEFFPNPYINIMGKQILDLGHNEQLDVVAAVPTTTIHFNPMVGVQGEAKGTLVIPSNFPFLVSHGLDEPFLQIGYLVYAGSQAADQLRNEIFHKDALEHRASAMVGEYMLTMEDMQVPLDTLVPLSGKVGKFRQGVRSLPPSEQKGLSITS